MGTQLFVKPISMNIIYSLLNKISPPIDKDIDIGKDSKDDSKDSKDDILVQPEYFINNIIYKKILYNNLLAQFLEELKPYYYNSKKYYVSRIINYPQFITIIRQICNYNNIQYIKKIIYVKNNYEITYYINPFEKKK